MMKTYLKRAFQLSDSGVKGLAKSIWSFFLYYVSFVPPMICVFLFADRLLNGNTGKPVVYLLFMLAATLVMYLVINYNYKTTYDETYQESATLRIDLAEQLSKLPLSYFSKHNLSDLAQTIMADVASIEHAFANAVSNSIESSDHPDDSCYNRPNFIYSSYWNHGDCWPFNARLRSGKYPDSSGLYYYGGETQRGHGWRFALSDGNLLFGRKNCPDW